MEESRKVIREYNIAGFHVLCRCAEVSEAQKQENERQKVKKLLEILTRHPAEGKEL